MPEILRYTAFSDDPAGGNPAGVVLDASTLDAAAMQAIAADLGYSETAFLLPAAADGTVAIRYFSPRHEVPFCGHATIAAAVAYAARRGAGVLTLATAAGPVEVATQVHDGRTTATLTSVPPAVREVPPALLAELLAILGWSPDDLDPDLPPRVGYAGAHHPILAAARPERLDTLDYDLERLRAVMVAEDLTTVALVHRRDATTFTARNAFAVGGVAEDPATGAAAAALGAVLRALELVPAGRWVRVTVHQGAAMGRPSVLLVDIPPDVGSPVRVTGTAVPLDDRPAGSAAPPR